MSRTTTAAAIMDAITRALPGWRVIGDPQPFTSAPDRHFRARLAQGDRTQDVVIRRAWREEAYDVEVFVYREILPTLSLGTPRLWTTFVLDADGSRWTVLEDIGPQTADRTSEADRRAVLHALGRLHGEGAAWLDDGRRETGPLPRFGPGVVPYAGRLIPVARWHELLNGGLNSSSFGLEAWVHSLLDGMLRRLVAEPSTLLHGDVNFSNAVLAEGGVGLIDFERAFIGPPSLDIGRVAAMIQSTDELEHYCRGYYGSADAGQLEDIRDWADLGEVYDCYYWICYYIEETLRGHDLGSVLRNTLLDEKRARLSELRQRPRNLLWTD